MASKLTQKVGCTIAKSCCLIRTDKSTELWDMLGKKIQESRPRRIAAPLAILTAVPQTPRARKARPTFSALPSMTHSSVQKSEALYRATGVHEQEIDQKSV